MTAENRLTLDNPAQVFFYEQDHYYLSNFSAFQVRWAGRVFPTAEHAYQWSKFPEQCRAGDGTFVRGAIRCAPSAHEAYKLADMWSHLRRPEWDEVKVWTMTQILRAKVDQHEYVRRKLLETGDRELIENSWRDAYWGWGPQRDGQNMLGRLWMILRGKLRAESIEGFLHG